MNAIDLLEKQHHEVEALFKKAQAARGNEKRALVEEIADALAIHATIEEKIFYPTVKAERTEDILLESLEEHLGIKRVIVDLLDASTSDDGFDAKLKVLCEQVDHHVGEERSDLFPKVRKLLERDHLESLGEEMQAMASTLEGTRPRESVRRQTGEAAPLP